MQSKPNSTFSQTPAFPRWYGWLATGVMVVFGAQFLCMGVASIQKLIFSLADPGGAGRQPELENLIAPLAVIFFMAGWLLAHLIGTVLAPRSRGLALSAMLAFVVVLFLVRIVYVSPETGDVVYDFFNFGQPLAVSGFFLRSAIVSPALWPPAKMLK